MPIYGFECDSCGHRFDRLQKLSDADPIVCPECGAETLRRQLTAPSFRLSGSGWYETDFKKDGDKKRNLTEKGEGANSSKSEPAGSDAASNSKAGQPAGSESASNSKAGNPSASGDTAKTKPIAKPDPKPVPKPASE
jgi:putative FmdB family regulatory protein